VDEAIVVAWDRGAARLDVDQRPTGVGEVDRTVGEPLDRVAAVEGRVQRVSVMDADRVGDVEQEAATDRLRLLLTALGVELHERVEEVDRERRRPNEYVALVVDSDHGSRGIDVDAPKVLADRRRGAVEERLDLRRATN